MCLQAVNQIQYISNGLPFCSFGGFLLLLAIALRPFHGRRAIFLWVGRIQGVHIAIEVMVADVLEVTGDRILADPLEVISGHGSFLLIAESVLVVKDNFIAIAGGNDSPVADRRRDPDKPVFEKDSRSMALAVSLQCVALLAVEFGDGAAMPTEAIPCGIGFLECLKGGYILNADILDVCAEALVDDLGSTFFTVVVHGITPLFLLIL